MWGYRWRRGIRDQTQQTIHPDFTQPPLFDDSTQSNENKREEVSPTLDTEETTNHDTNKASTSLQVHELFETLKKERLEKKAFITKMCECLDEERQLNAKLTSNLEEESKQGKEREKEFHNKLGEVDTGMKTLP